ncbi:MAG: ATP-binding protein [Bacteroidales bacterium]|nr:ATP-binding protein [Bacteroidales bacterium]
MTNYKLGIWEEYSDKSQNHWSDQVYEILSLEKPFTPSIEMLGKQIVEDDQKQFADFLGKLVSDKSKKFIALSVKLKVHGASRLKYVFITAERIFDTATRKHLFWQGTLLDITPQIEFERHLQQSIDNFKGILNRIPLLVLTTDVTGAINFWNKGCEEVTGFSKVEVIGARQFLKQLLPDKQQREKLVSFSKDSHEKSLWWEGELITKKGTQKIISWTAIRQPFIGKSTNMVIIGVDVTKRKQQEKLNTENRKRQELLAQFSYNLLNQSVSDNIYQFLGKNLENFAKSSVYVVCSAVQEKDFYMIEGVYGLSQGEFKKLIANLGWNPIGRRFQIFPEQYNQIGSKGLLNLSTTLYELSDGVVSSVASRAIERQLDIERLFTMGFFDGKNLSGGILMLAPGDVSASEILLVEGFITQCTPAIRQRVREMRLMEKLIEAQLTEELNSTFLANLSHEIRAPMNAILGFSRLLKLSNISKEKRQQYVDIINTKGSTLLKLINDIVDVTKVETKQLMQVNKPFNINSMLSSVYEFYQEDKIFQQREAIDIVLDLPEFSDSLMLNSDEGRIEQVLSSLMNNALKFTEKGEIRFGYTIEEEKLEFFVSDTGIGIDPCNQQIIFDRYRQLNGDSERLQTGVGLGLAISKGVVELMGGSIWVESEPGVGTTFRFTVPYSKTLVSDEISSQSTTETEYAYHDWKNKVLLVAEDEESNYLYISELLEPTGVKVIRAKDGAQAVELVNSIKKFDAVLMDIKMPIKDGYAATLEIRHINPNIPIIAQTAYAFTEDREKAEAAGCDEYIVKPINSKELLDTLGKYLG